MRRMLAAAALVVLAGAAGAPAHAADKLRVGTPEATAFAFAILNVGIGAGMFQKHDLDVERIDFAGGSKMQQGMTTGAIDLSVAGNTELAFVAKGVPEICVAVTAGPPADMALIVRADNDITKPADLKGRTIGVTSETSLTSYLALAFSQRQGWGNDGVKRAYIGGISASISALFVKNVDGFVGSLESGLILQAQGKARPLVNFGEIGLFITHLMTASDVLVRDHPDQVKRFVAAWFDTIKWMESHKQETVRLVEPATGLSADLAGKVYDTEMPAISKDGRFDPKAVAATMDSFIALGLLTSVPKDKALYTERFLP